MRRVAGYGLPQCAAHDHRHRGRQPRRGRGAGRAFMQGGCAMTSSDFERVALIGIGLIGSSISHATPRGGLARRSSARRRPRRRGRRRCGSASSSAAYATARGARCKDADLVILCVPVGACGAVAAEIGRHLKPGAILTDVGSVKGAVVRDVARTCPKGVHFIPGHPIAGTEHSGPESGFAELFDSRWCVLTPPPRRRSGGGRSPEGVLAGARLQRRDHGRRASRPGARPSPAMCRT